ALKSTYCLLLSGKPLVSNQRREMTQLSRLKAGSLRVGTMLKQSILFVTVSFPRQLLTSPSSSQGQQTQPSPSRPSHCPLPLLFHRRACPVQPRAHPACRPSSRRRARTSCLSLRTLGCTQPHSCPSPCGERRTSRR